MTTALLLLLLTAAATAAGESTKSSPSPPPQSPDSPTPPSHSRRAARSPSPPQSPPPPPPQSPPPSPALVNCTDELVSFSRCLPYTSSPPNNISSWPSRQCCNDVISAFTSGGALCLCYLIQKPKLLGFPVNSTKVLSLTSVCPEKRHVTTTNFSLASLCSGNHTLPPLKSISSPDQSSPRFAGPEFFPPRISGPANPPPPPPPPSPPPPSPPPPPTVNFTQGSQETGDDSESPAPSYSDTVVPAVPDIEAPPNEPEPRPEPRLTPRLPSWRPVTPISGSSLVGCSLSSCLLWTLLFFH